MDRKESILIVDDDESTRRILTIILGKKGYETETAGMGREAKKRAQERFFNVALLDIKLPDVEGTELIAHLKEMHPDMVVIMVTGHASLDSALQALNEGASAYITKPLNMDEVLGRVREALEKQRLVVENRRLYQAAQQELAERKQAEAKLQEMFTQVEKSHADMLSILNELLVGTAITDEDGHVTFLSRAAEEPIGKSREEVQGKHWEEVFPLKGQDKRRLKSMIELSPWNRKKLPVHIEAATGQHYWMDIEVKDDPRNERRRIFFFYDMSQVHDLRCMLDKEAQFHGLVSKGKPMKLVVQQIQEVARVNWTVLIEGETGAGKELVARAIHFSSQRREKPFIPVNCAGLTDSLLASQLFGHKRGAFTGAVEDHEGLFEAANGGTLFLDEIGDLSTNVQTSLLRALEEREVTRLGESKVRRVDVRVIAATHTDLSEEVEKGNFRRDLFYRIRVARITLPPLREHREDIPLLVGTFLGQSRAAIGKQAQEVSNEAMRKLLEHNWPGNVRELRSAVAFAVIHCKGSVIHPEDLPPEVVGGVHALSLLSETPQDEKERLLSALEEAKGNRTVAARLLGISRATLYRRLASLDMRPAK